MSDPTEQENRLRQFATFFKGYMGVMPLVTAAVAPLLTMMKAIPVFEAQKSMLATYSGLLGFLLLAWLFYMRGALAKAMVPLIDRPSLKRNAANFLPLFLILGSVACFMAYLAYLGTAFKDIVEGGPIFKNIAGRGLGVSTFKEVLEKIEYPIPYQTTLMVLYLGIFLCAEMAFVLMALREYAYGVLKVPESEILGAPVDVKPPAR